MLQRGPEEGAATDERSHRARFLAVYQATYHHVLGYAMRRTASREDAEDVVAETFLTAWRRLDQLPESAGARPWLYGIARKTLDNQRRGNVRRTRLVGRMAADGSGQRVHDLGEDTAALAAAFESLGEKDREVLALAAWEGLDAGEIATVLSCSRNAARIRLHRARRRLAAELMDVQRLSVRRAEAP